MRGRGLPVDGMRFGTSGGGVGLMVRVASAAVGGARNLRFEGFGVAEEGIFDFGIGIVIECVLVCIRREGDL